MNRYAALQMESCDREGCVKTKQILHSGKGYCVAHWWAEVGR